MNHRKFGTHTQAVAGVIEALLLVALVAIIISMIQLVYIPQVMEQKESEHMDQVFNQFSTMKSMIDLEGMTRSSAPISSMLTLGSRDLPYFITAKAYGGLSITNNTAYRIQTIPVMNPSPNFPGYLPANGSITLTSINYEADNSYFVDQSYILEGGGIIVKQPDGEPVMRADPSFSIENKTSDTVKIHFDLPVFFGMIRKNSTYGEGNCFIRSTYSHNITYIYTFDINEGIGEGIRIYTEYLNAWNKTLNNTLGFYVNHSYLNMKIVTLPGTQYIEIKPEGKKIFFELNMIVINIQIGPGFIKNT